MLFRSAIIWSAMTTALSSDTGDDYSSGSPFSLAREGVGGGGGWSAVIVIALMCFASVG